MSPPRFDRRTATAVAELLRDAARAEIMPRFQRLAAGAVRSKTGPLDLVTDADEGAERVIAASLAARFPGCLVVGEEGAAADPCLLGRLADADLAFVVDPVDGTANFAAGLPLFGCMVAAMLRGEVVAGWIHDPLGDDTAVALRGEGAWIEAPDGSEAPLRVAAPAPLERMLGDLAWTYLPEPLRTRVASRAPLLAGTAGLRCAAHAYRSVAGGYLHLLLFHRLMPWDHAAGWLLHREAGGHAAGFDGQSYSPLRHSGGLICAPDAACWDEARVKLLEP